jgi:hypothetical protein
VAWPYLRFWGDTRNTCHATVEQACGTGEEMTPATEKLRQPQCSDAVAGNLAKGMKPVAAQKKNP